MLTVLNLFKFTWQTYKALRGTVTLLSKPERAIAAILRRLIVKADRNLSSRKHKRTMASLQTTAQKQMVRAKEEEDVQGK